VWNRFAALNDVGGAPGRFGLSLEAFHAANQARAARWPRNLLASTTHDTKRSEDVRARLALLAERPWQWADFVERARRLAAPHRQAAGPDEGTFYLYLQTLVGAWPLSAARAEAYMLKAVREAKRQTSWTRTDSAFEQAVTDFVKNTLADQAFAAAVEEFVSPLLRPGRENSLAQLLLKLTAPGVPDIYQGSELWDLRLVDPDNRDLVDFGIRAELLAALEGATPSSLAARLDDPADPGLPKLWVLRETLRVRRQHAAAFGPGASYEAWQATGARSDEVIAFLRGGEVATVVSRWPLRRAGAWEDTALALPPGRWRDAFSGATRRGPGPWPMKELQASFPVALLVREAD
jgi:(1->4)-alpha-D-glucan 1-alpha-D-glucosylmutase